MEHQVKINTVKVCYNSLPIMADSNQKLSLSMLKERNPLSSALSLIESLDWLATYTPKHRLWFVHELLSNTCGFSTEDNDTTFEFMLLIQEGKIRG